MIDGCNVFLPVGRGTAFWRAVLLATPAAMLGASSAAVYGNLSSGLGTVPRGLVDASLWILALPLPLLGLLCGASALRWLLLAAWPGVVGISADDNSLSLQLGPFGSKHFPASELEIRYPFESVDSEATGDDRSFEALLPQEQQLELFLPNIAHPQSRIPLNRQILKFTGLDEREAASKMAPAIGRWRKTMEAQDS